MILLRSWSHNRNCTCLAKSDLVVVVVVGISEWSSGMES